MSRAELVTANNAMSVNVIISYNKLREAFKKKSVTFVTLGLTPPPDFGKSVTIFLNFFLASRPRDWNFLSKEFFSKMLGNFFNLRLNF